MDQPPFTIATMTDEDTSEWARKSIQVLAIPSEIVVAAKGYPGLIATGAVLLEGLIPRRQRDAEEFVGIVAAAVDPDRLADVIQSDDERREVLWASTQAVMSTGMEGKRILLARVVANAMTSTEPIDEAQILVAVLSELDAPHIRALVRIRDADDRNQDDPGLRDEILQDELRTHPYPILAALARTGAVRQGSEMRSQGLASFANAETLSISGISDFGRKLLEDLESVNTEV